MNKNDFLKLNSLSIIYYKVIDFQSFFTYKIPYSSAVFPYLLHTFYLWGWHRKDNKIMKIKYSKLSQKYHNSKKPFY